MLKGKPGFHRAFKSAGSSGSDDGRGLRRPDARELKPLDYRVGKLAGSEGPAEITRLLAALEAKVIAFLDAVGGGIEAGVAGYLREMS